VAGRITRKELKSDKFALEVEQTVDYVAEHRRQLLQYGSSPPLWWPSSWAGYFYLRHQQSERAQLLAQAITIQEAPVWRVERRRPLHFSNGRRQTRRRHQSVQRNRRQIFPGSR